MSDFIERAFIIFFWFYAIGSFAAYLMSYFGETFQSITGALFVSAITVTSILYLVGCKIHEVFIGLD